jgi:hypothetical protein
MKFLLAGFGAKRWVFHVKQFVIHPRKVFHVKQIIIRFDRLLVPR